jgi:hypothetical protein
LIVIGLLGAIALIVNSAINPIEQSNRARDTKYKADAGQLISALERYFVAQSAFPWTTFDSVTYPSADSAVDFASASLQRYGLCGASCAADGSLILNDELKTEFRSRDFAKTGATALNQIKIGKASGSSSSIYACFTPLSKTIRDKACTDGKVYSLATSVRTSQSGASCASTAAGWASGTLVICLPE